MQLDYSKLVEGSGLSIGKVRGAVKWLIANKKIEARKVFGNKTIVKLLTPNIPKPEKSGRRNFFSVKSQ